MVFYKWNPESNIGDSIELQLLLSGSVTMSTWKKNSESEWVYV